MKQIYILLLVVGCLSCSGNRTRADLQKIYGQKMTLPKVVQTVEQDEGNTKNEIKNKEGLAQWKIFNRDTIITLDPKLPKLLVYYNSQGCTSCRLKELIDWREYVREIQKLQEQQSDSAKVELVFLFATDKMSNELEISLYQYQFDIPVLCDTNNYFAQENILPENEQFNCFLLDNENKVILLGSPLHNPAMWKLYKKRIAELNSGGISK